MPPVVKLNNEIIKIDCSSMSTLTDIAEKIAENFFEPKEVVTELFINGSRIEESAVAAMGETPISEIDTVNFNTVKNPAEKVIALLRSMSDYLAGFSAGVEEVANQFRMGSPEEANRILVLAIEGVVSFTQLLDTVRLVTDSDLSDLSLGNQSLKAHEQKLLDITKKMRSSQEEKDWVTVADMLEYELGPLMADWKEMIPLLEGEVLKSV